MHINVNFKPSDTDINANISQISQHIPVAFNETIGSGEDTLGMRMNNTLVTYTNRSVDEIPSYCLAHCSSLKSVDMPNVQYIGQYAFMYTAVEKVAFPNLANLIDYVFYNAYALRFVDLSAASLGKNVFYGAYQFKTLILRHNDIVEIDYSTFAQTGFLKSSGGGTVYVPSALLEKYENEAWLEIRERLIDVTFQSIEDSPYEHYYADGTPVE